MDGWIPMWQWHNVGPAPSPGIPLGWISPVPQAGKRKHQEKPTSDPIIHINLSQFKACNEGGWGEGAELDQQTSHLEAQHGLGAWICSCPSAQAETQAIKRIMRSFWPSKKVIHTHHARMGGLNCPTPLWVKWAPVSFVLVTEKKKSWRWTHSPAEPAGILRGDVLALLKWMEILPPDFLGFQPRTFGYFLHTSLAVSAWYSEAARSIRLHHCLGIPWKKPWQCFFWATGVIFANSCGKSLTLF